MDSDSPAVAAGDENSLDTVGPGQAYGLYLEMDELLDKLKLIDYDKQFIGKSASYKPISRYVP